MIYLIILVVIAFISFFIYWYVKFKHVLPVYQRIEHLEKIYVRFEEFVYSVLSVSTNFHKDDYINLLNMVFIKLNSVFPDTSIYVFENNEGQWSYIGGVNNSESQINFSKVEPIISSIKNEIIFIEDGDILDGKIRKFAIIPLGILKRKIYAIMFCEGDEKEILIHYSKFLLSFMRFIRNYYESFDAVSVETKRLRMELDSLVKELESQGSRLIKKHKEAKIIYEGISSFDMENDNPLRNLLSLIYNSLKPYFAVYYSYDEGANILSPNIFLPGNMDLSRYSAGLNDHDLLLVKSFVNKNPLYVYNEDEINDPILKENNIKTAVLFPIYNSKTKFGVLLIGMKDRRSFTKDDMFIMELISKEIAVTVNIFELYNKVSKDAVNLANLNKIKDDFLATVNHEIKTPLTTIKGFVSVLLSGEVGSLNEQQSAFLTMVDQATNRLINIVTNLLDISKLNSETGLEMEKTDMVELAESAITGMRIKTYSKGITVKFEKEANKIYIMADRHWIVQVINNLMDNAIKYSPNGSEIKVKIYDRGSVVVFSVEDKGYGIDEADKKYVFEKFYRAKDTMLNVEGSGLGLSIARTIVEKHNGKIWFESEKGKGSKFYFALPKIKENI